jgi:3-carboxy-cis,cis-muconate cycloisomerase
MTDIHLPSSIFEGFLSTGAMLRCFDAPAFVQAMLDFEAALARAQADAGVIPPPCGEAIAGCCRAELIDVPGLVEGSGTAGSLAIPLVRQLTARVKEQDAQAAGYVHWGTTTQDVVDTAMALVSRRALALIERDLERLVDALRAVQRDHGDAPVLGRTLLQPAQVVSLGFKMLSWIGPLVRSQQGLRTAGEAALQLQLGGAVGTLSVMGAKAGAVVEGVARRLALKPPAGAWHTQRDTQARLACELGLLCGALAKLARDLALMSQAEVGELAEPSGQGRGGSSAMPHKRNPVGAMVALADTQRAPFRVAAVLGAMAQEQERGLGNWQAELAEMASLFVSAHGAVNALADAMQGLTVDRQAMRRNIDSLHGVVFAEAASMAIARQVGKSAAHALMEKLSREALSTRRPLQDLVLEAIHRDEALRAQCADADIARLFDPATAAGHASDVARPQLQALFATVDALRSASTWGQWLNTQETAHDAA